MVIASIMAWAKRLGKWERLLMFFIAGFFLINAFYGFPDSPAPWFDQGINLGIARTYAEDGIFTLRLGPGQYVENRPLMTSTNYPLFWFIIAAFKLFGVGLIQAQVVMFFFLAAFLAVTFALIKRWYGPRSALLGIGLIVTFLPFYGNGMSGGLGEVPGLVYLLLGLIFLEKDKPWHTFICGLFFGLGGATKVFYLVTIGALGVSEIYRAIRERRVPVQRWAWLAAGVIIPLLIWLRTLLPDGLSLTGVRQAIAYYSNPYDVGGTVVANIMKFFTESTLIHFSLLAAVFIIFLAVQIRKRQLRQGEVLIFVFFILNVLFFLRTPGWFRYLFPAHIIVLVVFPVALNGVAEIFRTDKLRRYTAPVLVGLVIMVQSIHLLRERDRVLYYNPAPREFALRLEQTLGGAADVFVVDKPELWFLLKSKLTRQYINVNPYIQLGEDVFATGNLPVYIVSGEPKDSAYLSANDEFFRENYTRADQHGAYVLFKSKPVDTTNDARGVMR